MKLLIYILGLFALLGCRKIPNSSVLQDPVLNRNVVVIAAGGYMSCLGNDPHQMQFSDQFRWLLSALARQYQVPVDQIPYVLSCYKRRGAGSELLYASSERARTYQESVLSAARRFPQAKIFLIGHSWGGTLTIEMSRYLRRQLGAQAQMYLTTIDAIDPKYCSPPLINIMNNPACQSYPVRLRDPQYRQTTFTALRGWRHYFQTDGSWLHSTAIPGLDAQGPKFQNTHLRLFGIAPHGRLAKQDVIWQSVLEFDR